MRRSVRDEDGIAFIEMAIVLPVLLLVLFAIVEFGIALAKFQVITNASGSAARAAALFRADCNAGNMQSAATDATRPFVGRLGLTAAQLTPSITGDCSSQTVSATVRVSEPFPVVSALASGFAPLVLEQTTTEFNLNALRNDAGR